jgi:hypothetical protein
MNDPTTTGTALVPTTAQDADTVLSTAQQRANALMTTVAALDISDEYTAGQANEMLGSVARALRQTEAERVELTGPLVETKRKLDARFKATSGPLEQAQRALKDKLLAWQAEQERAAQQAAEKAAAEARQRQAAEDERRRAAEDQARREREAAARAAAAAEAEQKAAERRRREQLDAKRSELAAEVAALDDDGLNALADSTDALPEPGSDDEIRYGLAIDEQKSRRAAREASERAAYARQVEQEAREREQAARDAAPLPVPAPPPPAPAGPIRTEGATTSRRMVWKAEILAVRDVPVEFLQVDMAAVLRRIRETGGQSVPGIRSWQEPDLSVRAR